MAGKFASGGVEGSAIMMLTAGMDAADGKFKVLVVVGPLAPGAAGGGGAGAAATLSSLGQLAA